MGTKKDFIRKTIKSADFWVRVDAISTGVSVGTESALLAYGALLPAVPFAVGGLGLFAAAVLGSCALYSLYVGATGTWDFLKEAHRETFHPDKPKKVHDKPESTLIDRLAHHPRIYPLAKKIADTKIGKKILNSGIGKKIRFGLTQGQRDIFMVSLNTKGSLFVGVAAVTYIVMHTMALPAITLAAAVTWPVAIAALWAAKSTFDISCSMRVLFKRIRENRAKKRVEREAKKNPQPAPAPAPVPAPSPAPAPVATPAFDKAAAAPEQKAEAAAAPKPETPPPSPPPAKPTPPSAQ